jgi:hypothetical protein
MTPEIKDKIDKKWNGCFAPFMREAATFGYNLAKDEAVSDAVAFADWLACNAAPRLVNKGWILNSNGKKYTTEQLFEHFKKGE